MGTKKETWHTLPSALPVTVTVESPPSPRKSALTAPVPMTNTGLNDAKAGAGAGEEVAPWGPAERLLYLSWASSTVQDTK